MFLGLATSLKDWEWIVFQTLAIIGKSFLMYQDMCIVYNNTKLWWVRGPKKAILWFCFFKTQVVYSKSFLICRFPTHKIILLRKIANWEDLYCVLLLNYDEWVKYPKTKQFGCEKLIKIWVEVFRAKSSVN